SGLIRLFPKLSKKNVSKPLFKLGDKVGNRWIINGMIGSGGYGQIYYAIDERSEEQLGVAIKTESKIRKGKTSKRMILEQKVLLRLQGRSHAPLMWGSGSTSKVNYIIMQLLSKNLSDIRKQSPYKRFSRSTTGRILIQGIAGLRDLHHIGYIHRDVKPQNICFGLTEVSKHRLIFVDFGLARRYRYNNGQIRPLREGCGFRGTTIYASLRSHEGMDLGPADDLISLYYSAIEMVRGSVPWKRSLHSSDIKMAKFQMQEDDFRAVSKYVGEGFRELGRAVTCMDADDEPNYYELQKIMMEFTANRPLSDPYDWDNDFEEVLQENHLNRHLRF
ncbi:Putative casein kinase I C03C10.2, partial [Toxocara canis]